MDIKIGIQNIAREVSVETDESGETIQKKLTDALQQDGGVLTITDPKGRTVIIPAHGIGYVDLGQEHQRPVGFGTL